MNDGDIVMPEQQLNGEVVRSFQSGLSGRAIRPGDDEYDGARTLYNAMIDKRPALIARCETTDDVVRAVTFAREQDIPLSVRGGGHNVAGTALVDNGLTIDLSQMNGVQVDPENRTARVQGGAIWREVDRVTHEHGLATPGGTFSPTGVGGLTLGGGIAWLMRSYGLTCDNLLRAEVVTAGGEIIYASETENPGLFWGLRGGGGNFGVVTEFEFRLHPVHTVLGGMIVHPIDRAKEALTFYREFTQTAPDEVTTFTALMTTPERQRVVATVPCYAGDLEQGEETIKPLLEWGPPIQAQVGPMPYPQFQQMMDDFFPDGLHNYWTSIFLEDLEDDVIDIMLAHFNEVTSPLTVLLLEHLGGAVSRMPRDATAFPHRNAKYNVSPMARWTDPAEADRHISWARGFQDAVWRYSTGAGYVNYLGEEDQDRVRTVYGPETYARLAEIKAKYDPDNAFRANQNIQPAR
jgi:FAD/FMN-containing dehydrogenase